MASGKESSKSDARVVMVIWASPGLQIQQCWVIRNMEAPTIYLRKIKIKRGETNSMNTCWQHVWKKIDFFFLE